MSEIEMKPTAEAKYGSLVKDTTEAFLAFDQLHYPDLLKDTNTTMVDLRDRLALEIETGMANLPVSPEEATIAAWKIVADQVSKEDSGAIRQVVEKKTQEAIRRAQLAPVTRAARALESKPGHRLPFIGTTPDRMVRLNGKAKEFSVTLTQIPDEPNALTEKVMKRQADNQLEAKQALSAIDVGIKMQKLKPAFAALKTQ